MWPLSARGFARQSALQSNDLVVLIRDVVNEDQRVGKTGPIKSAVDFRRDDSFAITVGRIDDVEGDLHVKNLAVAPGLDRGPAAELPSDVLHQGIIRVKSDERIGIMVVDGPNVGFDKSRQLWFHGKHRVFVELGTLIAMLAQRVGIVPPNYFLGHFTPISLFSKVDSYSKVIVVMKSMARRERPGPGHTHEPLDKLMGILSSPWTLLLLHRLHIEGPKRFGELKRRLGGISTKTLTERLRMLEAEGWLTRHYRPTVPPQVTYAITKKVLALDGVMTELDRIAERWYGKNAKRS